MNRDDIYEQLNEQRVFIMRHECTARIMAATDVLLDQLLEVQYAEAFELLQEEANVS